MKTILTLACIPSVLVAWTAYLTTHPNFVSLDIVPEWNGPDYKVTYECSDYNKLEGLHMEDKGGDIVTVNYGALGRRYQRFVCK